MKKRLVLCATLVALLSLTGGCSKSETVKRGANAPLETEGSIAPPPGCVELRKRGGAC